MYFVLLVLIVIGLIVYTSVQKARKRQLELLKRVQDAIPASFGQPVTLKQGNVRVSVTTNAHADDPRFQPMAEEIAKAFSSTASDLSGNAETWVKMVQEGGALGISQAQADTIRDAVRNRFGGQVDEATFASPDAAANETFASPSTSEQQPETVVFAREPLRPKAQTSSERPAENDPFASGDVFEAHRQAAEASFDRSTRSDRDDEAGSDPFRRS